MATTVGREKSEDILMPGLSCDKRSIIIIVVKVKQILCYTKEGIILETPEALQL